MYIEIFRRTTKTGGDAKENVRLRLVDGRSISFYHKTGVKALSSDLDKFDKDGSLKKRVTLYNKELHDTIKTHIDAMEKVYTNAKDKGTALDGVIFERLVDEELHPEKYAQENKPKTFFDLADEYLKQATFSDGYRKQICVTLRAISRYEGFVRATGNSKFVFDAETIDRDVIEGFQDYVRNEYDLSQEYPEIFKRLVASYPVCVNEGIHRPISNHGENSVHNRLKQMRVMWNWLLQTHRVTNNPFADFKNSKESYGTPYYLALTERDQIASAQMPTEALTRQRDIFIFQCYVGCRVSDLMTFTEKNIVDDILQYIPLKTHLEKDPTTARVPLHPTAKALIEKYRGQDAKGRLFPFTAPQKYNNSLKRIFEIAGINRNVAVRNSLTGKDELKPLYEVASSHLARKTFVANLYLKIQDPSIISKMSGHSENSEAFSRYRKIEDEILTNAVTAYL